MAPHPTRVFSLTLAELGRALSKSLDDKAPPLKTSNCKNILEFERFFPPLQAELFKHMIWQYPGGLEDVEKSHIVK